MTTWQNCDTTQRKEVFAALQAVYDKHGCPKGLKNPVSSDECINILQAGVQQNRAELTIEGNFGESDKDLVEALTKDIKDAVASVSDAEVKIGIARGVGASMGEIVNVGKLEGDGEVTVKHEAGQVILLDFWATWCPPCQAPMAHNQEMLTHNKEKWGDKVRIIGLSIDQDRAKLQNHVKDKGWTSVEHYWARNGKNTADKDFKVQGVPHCALVDTNGKIVWIGHPASRKLEEDINALLEGKELSGVEGGDEEEEGGDEASGDLDIEKAGDAAAIFKLQSSELFKAEDLKKQASSLQRGFVVLVTSSTLNAKDHKTKTSMTCHTVLVGPKDAVGNVQAVTIGLTHADGVAWKNKEQIREM